MLEKYNKYKLLKVFLDYPMENFRLREISRMSKISPPSVMAYLKEFEKEKLIERVVKRKVPFYRAKRDEEDFKFCKKISILFELHKSGIIDYIWEKMAPECIILYGGYAKGESVEDSDIDLFIVGREVKINIGKYEKELGKEIHIINEENIDKVSKELKNNLINGIVLKGYFKVLK